MEAKKVNLITDSTIAYWKNILLDDVKLLDLPSRKLTVKNSVDQGSLLRTQFSADVTSKVKANIVGDNKIEAFFITALSILLQRYTNQIDIAFGLTFDDNDNAHNNLALFRNSIDPRNTCFT